MKILTIVPVFNEEKTIQMVIDDLKKNFQKTDILIVNDGSRDKSSDIARKNKNVRVIDLPTNLGIGGSVQTGFKYAVRNNYDIAIQFDGDGQHLAMEIPTLIQPILNKKADVVIGSRFLRVNKKSFKSPWPRRIGIKIFEWLNSFITGQKVTDNTSGFRAYNREAFSFLAYNYPTDYPEPEAVVLLGRNRFKIFEIPTEMKERVYGKSSISGFKSFYYMIKVILCIIMTSLRYRER